MDRDGKGGKYLERENGKIKTYLENENIFEVGEDKAEIKGGEY